MRNSGRGQPPNRRQIEKQKALPKRNTRHLPSIFWHPVTFHDRRTGDGTHACDSSRGRRYKCPPLAAPSLIRSSCRGRISQRPADDFDAGAGPCWNGNAKLTAEPAQVVDAGRARAHPKRADAMQALQGLLFNRLDGKRVGNLARRYVQDGNRNDSTFFSPARMTVSSGPNVLSQW